MPTVYRIDWVDGDAIGGPPRPVHVDQIGWPHLDADGRDQLANTHFATELEAWEALLRNTKAIQDGSAQTFGHYKREFAQATEQLAEDAARRSRVELDFEQWQRRQLAVKS